MRRTITVNVTRREPQTFEIEFPIYRCQVVDSEYPCTIWDRWDSDGTEWSITHNIERDSEGWDINRGRRQFGDASGGNHNDSADYVLGHGDYACTADEFAAALAEARAFMARVDG